MGAFPEIVKLKDVGDAVGRPAARRFAALRIADYRIEIPLFELRLDGFADNLFRAQRERHEIEQVPAVDHDAAVAQVGIHDDRAPYGLGLGNLTYLGEQVAVACIAVVRIAHRGHQVHLSAMKGLGAGFHVFHGHEIEPHLRFFARHVGHAGILAPLPPVKAVLVANVVEAEIPHLRLLAECPEHPLRDGNVVDLGGNRLEHRRLEEQVGILPVHPVNLGPGRGNPCIVLEIRLLIPLIQGTADKLGTDVEQHALVVLRSVNTVGRGFSVGQEFGLGNSPR